MKYILLFISILLVVGNSYAQETFIKDGNTFTVKQESEMQRRLREGDRVYYIVDGQLVPIKKVKACEWIPTGSLVPLQAAEDENPRDGNTDWVVVRTDTNVRIAKDVKPKEVMYAGPGD